MGEGERGSAARIARVDFVTVGHVQGFPKRMAADLGGMAEFNGT